MKGKGGYGRHPNWHWEVFSFLVMLAGCRTGIRDFTHGVDRQTRVLAVVGFTLFAVGMARSY